MPWPFLANRFCYGYLTSGQQMLKHFLVWNLGGDLYSFKWKNKTSPKVCVSFADCPALSFSWTELKCTRNFVSHLSYSGADCFGVCSCSWKSAKRHWWAWVRSTNGMQASPTHRLQRLTEWPGWGTKCCTRTTRTTWKTGGQRFEVSYVWVCACVWWGQQWVRPGSLLPCMTTVIVLLPFARITVERILNLCLVPYNLPPDERMQRLYVVYASVDPHAVK